MQSSGFRGEEKEQERKQSISLEGGQDISRFDGVFPHVDVPVDVAVAVPRETENGGLSFDIESKDYIGSDWTRVMMNGNNTYNEGETKENEEDPFDSAIGDPEILNQPINEQDFEFLNKTNNAHITNNSITKERESANTLTSVLQTESATATATATESSVAISSVNNNNRSNQDININNPSLSFVLPDSSSYIESLERRLNLLQKKRQSKLQQQRMIEKKGKQDYVLVTTSGALTDGDEYIGNTNEDEKKEDNADSQMNSNEVERERMNKKRSGGGGREGDEGLSFLPRAAQIGDISDIHDSINRNISRMNITTQNSREDEDVFKNHQNHFNSSPENDHIASTTNPTPTSKPWPANQNNSFTPISHLNNNPPPSRADVDVESDPSILDLTSDGEIVGGIQDKRAQFEDPRCLHQ